MLKIYSIALFIIVCFQVKAASNCSEIYFRLHNGNTFTISVDDKQYSIPCNNFHINNIFPGSHFFQVHKITPLDPMVPISYSGFIEIPASSKIYLLLTPDNQIRITNISPLIANSYNYIFPSKTSGYPEFYNIKEILPEEFETAKDAFKEIKSDVIRLAASKDLIYHNKLTSAQVADLLLLFSFDKERLSLAKFAYTYTMDPGNYNKVTKNFIFNGTSQELWNYLGNNYKYY
jgi:hypothetical protein